MMKDEVTLVQWARAAARGDRAAAEQLLGEIQGGVYNLALRMLGHPQDAEDATQEALLIILTHIASFRGDSAFRTWCWRVAANHFLRARRGRMEVVTFEAITELLETGIRDATEEPPDAEAAVLEREVRLRCTEGMLLSLDRDLRIAFVLSEILGLSGEEAAEVLDLDYATFRKRLSRARSRLLTFLRAQCGLFEPENPCRCRGQIAAALERELLHPNELLLAKHAVLSDAALVERCSDEVDELFRAAKVLRHPAYAPPPGPLASIRSLLDAKAFVLFRD